MGGAATALDNGEASAIGRDQSFGIGMATIGFRATARDLFARHGIAQFDSPWLVLESWKQFVEDCRSGYGISIYEYDNDLAVRNILELVIGDPDCRASEGFDDFDARVYEVDAEFKELLSHSHIRTDRDSWWERGVLKRAGAEYASDIQDQHGLTIEMVG